MGYASRAGRARTSATNPQAHAICDRCGFRHNHVDLRWQMDYAGAGLVNKRLLVCRTCQDEPAAQLRAFVIPADPVPIVNPRVEPFAWDQVDRRQLSGFNTVDPRTGLPVQQGDVRVTTIDGDQPDKTRVTQQTGGAAGSLNEEPGIDENAPGNDDPGLPPGFDDVPQTGPL
jgi:hypothetical protein